MKRFLTITISIALLVLCYAALDDITTEDEPSHVLEWMFVWLTVAWFVGLLVARIARRDT
ncbi:MAG: hypothetical protein WBN87_10825 [Thermoanaerobaculia bacterium]